LVPVNSAPGSAPAISSGDILSRSTSLPVLSITSRLLPPEAGGLGAAAAAAAPAAGAAADGAAASARRHSAASDRYGPLRGGAETPPLPGSRRAPVDSCLRHSRATARHIGRLILD
jgi:hypothetical protein